MFRWWFQIHHTSLPNSWAMWPDKSIKQLSSNASQTIPDDTSDTSDTTWYHTLCRQSDLLERSRVETSRRSQVTVNSRSACGRSDLVGDHMVYYIMVSRRLVKAFTIFHVFSVLYYIFMLQDVTRTCSSNWSAYHPQTYTSFLFPIRYRHTKQESPGLPLAVSWCVSTLLGLACWPDWDLATWLPRCARS